MKWAAEYGARLLVWSDMWERRTRFACHPSSRVSNRSTLQQKYGVTARFNVGAECHIPPAVDFVVVMAESTARFTYPQSESDLKFQNWISDVSYWHIFSVERGSDTQRTLRWVRHTFHRLSRLMTNLHKTGLIHHDPCAAMDSIRRLRTSDRLIGLWSTAFLWESANSGSKLKLELLDQWKMEGRQKQPMETS